MSPTSPEHLAAPELDTIAAGLGLRVGEVLRRTDKTLLAAAELGDQPVVVKLLLDGGEFWSAKWRHEIGVYQTFTEAPPPVRVPRLVHTDGERLLVLERLDARPLDTERYPRRPLDGGEAEGMLSALHAFHAWLPPHGRFAPIFDHPTRIDRYHTAGYLTETDAAALRRLLDRCCGEWEINHGDPLPSNLLVTASGDCALVDWEFTGWFLPGFDLAMLHTLLGAHTPNLRGRIDQAVAETGTEEAFTVNLAMVLTRELRIHRELPHGPLRDARLPMIETAWAAARDRLHARAGSRT